jgi:hypothetical protein
VADAREDAMRVRSGESIRVRLAIGERTVEVTRDGDGRHRHDRALRELRLETVELSLAIGEALSPAIVVDDDGDVIRVIERRGRAIERRVIEAPLR